MEIRDEHMPERNVLFIRRVGPYAENAGLAWQAIWQWVAQKSLHDHVVSMVGYGLDNPKVTPAHMLRYFACLEFNQEISADPDNNIGTMTLPGGRFAIYRMKGNYSRMPDFFAQLHEEVVRQPKFVPDYSRPFLEVYLNSPEDVGLENALTDLCIPIREEVETRETL